MELPATCYLTYLVPPPPCKQALKLGRNCDNSHKHELLNFYCIGDDSSGTHLGKSRPLFLLFSRIACPQRWHNGINPESYLFNRLDSFCNIAVAFACWNVLLFLRLKTKDLFGQIWQLYAYVANESSQNVSRLMRETAKPSDSVATFYCIKEI